MLSPFSFPSVAVVGAGMAGSACAASLARAGWQVTVFDKSRSVGGRMSARRAAWADTQGEPQRTEFDHGAQHFSARHPRFRAAMLRAESTGCLVRWQPRVHARWPAPVQRSSWVPVPNMPALCRQLLGGVSVRLEHKVQRLQRHADGWHVVLDGGDSSGPFDQVMLAMPPAQAAVLLAGHHDAWADTLAAWPMHPCWTLMAATPDVDWPWDAAEPATGPFAWVVRNDRKPGRSAPTGCATWVAQATAAWSAAHLEDDAQSVAEALRTALQALLPGGRPVDWQHSSVHRWRYAAPAAAATDGRDCWWDAALQLGVCGDFLGSGDVESAWHSGDELADTVAACLDDAPGTPPRVDMPAVAQLA